MWLARPTSMRSFGRAALAVFLFGLIFVPTLLLTLTMVGVGPEEERLTRAGLLLPALLDAAMISVVLSSLSISTSALSKSRALTITAWVLLLFVPFVLASLVESIADHEWVYVISVPGALWNVGDALYKVEGDWAVLKWFYSAPVLLISTIGGGYGAWLRIRQAEVIT